MREYLIFAQTGDHQWSDRGNVHAHSPEAAIRTAIKNGVVSAKRIAAVPIRNWSVAEPEVEQRDPVIKINMVASEQLTVEDVLAEAESEGLVELVDGTGKVVATAPEH